jgi:uncharacterized protein (DUF1501 family)
MSHTCSRRSFLNQSSKSGVAGIASLSTLANLMTLSEVSAAYSFTDYKALICLFKFGGNDSFNMLVPYTNYVTTTSFAPFNEYQTRRGANALQQASLLPLSYKTGVQETNEIDTRLNNWNYGLHPSLVNLRNLYNVERSAAFMANVGTLVTPIANAIEAETKALPLGLYSHSDQIASWQTVRPDLRNASGWAARTADLIESGSIANNAFLNISLTGADPVLMGGGLNVQPYRISANGPVSPSFLGGNPEARNALVSLINRSDTSYTNLLDKTVRANQKRAYDGVSIFKDIVTNNDSASIDATFASVSPKNDLAAQLRTVAKMMAGRNTAGVQAKRQIFFVGFGGWDQHNNLLAAHERNLRFVDEAIGPFVTAVKNIGLWNSTTLFTCSDFGRTLTSNGDGSDHGWGGNTFVLGGQVRGGMIYGKYPRLAETVGGAANPLDTGRGRFVPTTPVEKYLEEILLWYGINPTDLNTILPNRSRFSTYAVPNILA